MRAATAAHPCAWRRAFRPLEWLIQVLNSVQYGLLLFLVASGLTLIFGIMGVINLAHGSFYMIGAYMAFRWRSRLGSLWTRACRWESCSPPRSDWCSNGC